MIFITPMVSMCYTLHARPAALSGLKPAKAGHLILFPLLCAWKNEESDMHNIMNSKLKFCGTPVTSKQLALVNQIIKSYPKLSRTELANTLCELLDWKRPNGGLKTIECHQFLENLHERSIISLPAPRIGRPRGSATRVTHTSQGSYGEPLEGELSNFTPISLELVNSASERALWRELVERYHYLGHRVPFGAHLRYLIHCEHHSPVVLGCIQFSSPAWRMQSRDQWIGWEAAAHKVHLQRIVSQSRFLILPWVRIKNLASHVLAQSSRRLVRDWEQHYGLTPWLLETMVDPARFSGTCYRAANWIEAGTTTGRGRQDRKHERHGKAPKTLWLYPLRRNACKLLCQVD